MNPAAARGCSCGQEYPCDACSGGTRAAASAYPPNYPDSHEPIRWEFCPQCLGDGSMTEAVCCGNTRDGECWCGNPVPEQIQCDYCGGRGEIEVLV